MTLKEARTGAFRLAARLATEGDGDSNGVVTVWRVRPRVFDFTAGYGPKGSDTVLMVHVDWIRDGWYRKYRPEWLEEAGLIEGVDNDS